MAGFPLAELHPNFLEKIAAKFEWRSYFRVQRTCRSMAEFVRSNKKARVSAPTHLYVEWSEKEDGSTSLDIWSPRIELEGLFGLRLTEFMPQIETDKNFKDFCDLLKKYRITCEYLNMGYFDRELRAVRAPMNEQYVELYRIVKPRQILIDSNGADVYESLSEWKKLKSVKINLHLKELLPAFQVVSQLQEISLCVHSSSAFNSEQFFSVLMRIFRSLRSEPLPILRHFECRIFCDEDLPPVEERLARLENFQLIYLREGDITGSYVYECTLGQLLFHIAMKPKEVEFYSL